MRLVHCSCARLRRVCAPARTRFLSNGNVTHLLNASIYFHIINCIHEKHRIYRLVTVYKMYTKARLFLWCHCRYRCFTAAAAFAATPTATAAAATMTSKLWNSLHVNLMLYFPCGSTLPTICGLNIKLQTN